MLRGSSPAQAPPKATAASNIEKRISDTMILSGHHLHSPKSKGSDVLSDELEHPKARAL